MADAKSADVIEPSKPSTVSSATAQTPPSRNPLMMAFLLTAISTAAYLDRSIMAFLVEPIKEDLALTDIQVSLLIGAAFSFFYAVMNVPAGIIVDRVDRRKLMLVTGFIWTASSIACGLSNSFWQLLVARMVLGMSEAFIGPSIYALMRDRIPVEKRGRSFSILGMGPYFGGAMSLILGGALLRSAVAGEFAGIPFVGGLEPWQIVVIAVAAIAFIPVIMVLLIPGDGVRVVPEKGEGTFGAAISYIKQQGSAYGILIGFITSSALIAFGVNSWIPTVMHRTYEIPLPEVGQTLGPLALLFGLGGLFVCGYILDRIQKRGGSIVGFAAVAMLLSGGGAAAMPLMPEAWQAWSLYCVSSFFTGAAFPIAAGLLSRLTPSILMGKVSALYLLFQSVIANVVGVTLIAFLSDSLFTGQVALGYALSLHCAIFTVTGVSAAVVLGKTITASQQAPA